MRIFSIILTALFLLTFVTPHSYAADKAAQDKVAIDTPKEKIFNAETFTLQNGMQVVVIPNHRVPVVTHMVWYKAGAADESWGKSGIAHFLEHIMFKGSEGLEPGEFSKRIKKMGGQDNAFTSQDYTAYFQNVSVDHLEDVMKMEAGRMRGATMPEDQVQSERNVILEERRQRTDNNPLNIFYEQMQNALFTNHPYGLPVIGWLSEMEQLNRDDAMNFYNIWYAPNNAILIVSGDITAAQLKPLAEKIYGVLPASPVPERNRPKVPDFTGTEVLTLSDPTIHNRQFIRAFRMPSEHEDKKTALALQVLDDILSNGTNARLYKSLVIDQKLATSASFSYDSTAYDESTAWFSANLKGDDVSFDQIDNAFTDEIRKIADEGIPEDELDRAKQRMIDAAVYARDSLSGPAMIFGYTLTTGGTIDDIEYWPHDIAQITADDVVNAAKTYLLDNNHYVTGHVIPPEGVASNDNAPMPSAMPPGGMLQ